MLASLQVTATVVAAPDQHKKIYDFSKWFRDEYATQVKTTKEVPAPVNVRHGERYWVLVDFSREPVTIPSVVALYGHRRAIKLAPALAAEYERSHASDQSADPEGSIMSDASALKADGLVR